VVEPTEGERIAVFRHNGRIAAISNVCAHQNGPLGEGRIIDGCITCPWHGFQYRFEDGCAPPPFTERLSTFRVRLETGIVFVDPQPQPSGRPAKPVLLEGVRIEGAEVSDA
jgi:nitrite reductase/ring-hydroxylating ferredoxin subunit